MTNLLDEAQHWIKEQYRIGGPEATIEDILQRHEILDKEGLYATVNRLKDGMWSQMAHALTTERDPESAVQIALTVALMLGAHLGRKNLL